MREDRNRLIEEVLGRQAIREFEELGRPDVEPDATASRDHLATAVALANLEALLVKAESMVVEAGVKLNETRDRHLAQIEGELMRQVAERVSEVIQAGARQR